MSTPSKLPNTCTYASANRSLVRVQRLLRCTIYMYMEKYGWSRHSCMYCTLHEVVNDIWDIVISEEILTWLETHCWRFCCCNCDVLKFEWLVLFTAKSNSATCMIRPSSMCGSTGLDKSMQPTLNSQSLLASYIFDCEFLLHYVIKI